MLIPKYNLNITQPKYCTITMSRLLYVPHKKTSNISSILSSFVSLYFQRLGIFRRNNSNLHFFLFFTFFFQFSTCRNGVHALHSLRHLSRYPTAIIRSISNFLKRLISSTWSNKEILFFFSILPLSCYKIIEKKIVKFDCD